ncbi:MAG: 5'-Nucleotidase domain protein, partial [Ignavibacteriaceae bacterium]|nr:5'-Nucleotidase domain protein [Ignavibacteriaceae bacterium]
WSSFTSTDNVNVSLYSRRSNSNGVFQAVFTRTGLNNGTPRAIRYRKFSSGSWNTSLEVSTGAPTGLQSAAVVEMNTTSAAFAYVGTNSTNAYFNNQDWTVDVQVEEGTPENYSLDQNYPNPFNPSTTIKFRIPESSFVSLRVYNVLGKEVATLVSEEMNAGSYEVNFQASNLSSGVYFYKLETGNFVKTNKMILMK